MQVLYKLIATCLTLTLLLTTLAGCSTTSSSHTSTPPESTAQQEITASETTAVSSRPAWNDDLYLLALQNLEQNGETAESVWVSTSSEGHAQLSIYYPKGHQKVWLWQNSTAELRYEGPSHRFDFISPKGNLVTYEGYENDRTCFELVEDELVPYLYQTTEGPSLYNFTLAETGESWQGHMWGDMDYLLALDTWKYTYLPSQEDRLTPIEQLAFFFGNGPLTGIPRDVPKWADLVLQTLRYKTYFPPDPDTPLEGYLLPEALALYPAPYQYGPPIVYWAMAEEAHWLYPAGGDVQDVSNHGEMGVYFYQNTAGELALATSYIDITVYGISQTDPHTPTLLQIWYMFSDEDASLNKIYNGSTEFEYSGSFDSATLDELLAPLGYTGGFAPLEPVQTFDLPARMSWNDLQALLLEAFTA